MTRINIYAKADEYDYDKPALLGWFDPATSEAFEQDTRWDGNNMIGVITGSQWIDEYLYRTKGGKWVRNNNATRYMSGPNTYEFLADDEARDWLLRSECNDEAIERFFGDVADEEDRRPGRPEIGGRATLNLGPDLLARIDAAASELGVSRAEAVRQRLEASFAGQEDRPPLRTLEFSYRGTLDGAWDVVRQATLPGEAVPCPAPAGRLGFEVTAGADVIERMRAALEERGEECYVSAF